MSSTMRSAIVAAIRAERAALGISQAELGERLAWSRQMVAKLEAGDRIVHADELPELCKALECDVLDLLGRARGQDRTSLGLDRYR